MGRLRGKHYLPATIVERDHVVCALCKEAVALLAVFTHALGLAISELLGHQKPNCVDHGYANAEAGENAPERRVATGDEIDGEQAKC